MDKIEPKPLPFNKKLEGISQKTLETHHDKLYVGYVKKMIEVGEALAAMREEVIAGREAGNQVHSRLRGLKEAETFATNGTYLHEWYFDVLGGDGDHSHASELGSAIAEKWGDVENFKKYFTECAMASRGWSLLVWSPMRQKLMQYNGDAHNQGGVWGCLPVIVLDVYEHAYFMDFGSDRKAYIEAFWKNFNWETAEKLFKIVSRVRL